MGKKIIEKPNYYAVIPSEVRYSEVLSSSEKLLFGEITALSNKEGYCWATNSYFAKLYHVSIRTIGRWFANLSQLGFIEIEVDSKKGNLRKISVNHLLKKLLLRTPKKTTDPIDKNVYTHDKTVLTPIDKNVLQNNTSINNINKRDIESPKNGDSHSRDLPSKVREKETDPRIKFIIDHYYKEHLDSIGFKPDINGKIAQIIKKRLTFCEEEGLSANEATSHLKEIITWALEQHHEDSRFPLDSTDLAVYFSASGYTKLRLMMQDFDDEDDEYDV